MPKRYYHRDGNKPDKSGNNDDVNKPDQVHQAASVACVLEDEETVEELAVNDAAILPLFNLKQKETVENIVVNKRLDKEKKIEVKELFKKYKEIFSDVPTLTWQSFAAIGRRSSEISR